MVHIVGAGPGAEDLITVRGLKFLKEADIVIYAGSLVNPGLLKETKPGAVIYDSAKMTLEQVMAVIKDAWKEKKEVVRLHTGDPCLYGAIREQMDEMDKLGITYDICPGVSSFCGTAAALQMEYTLPGISQSVVITRMAGRTPVPERESIRNFASHQATMVIFLSTGMLKELSEELIAGGYPADTPAAIVYKATWPEEKTVRTTIAELAEAAEREHITKTALIVVGNTVAQSGYDRSKLYDPGFTTEFRMAESSHSRKMVQAVPEMKKTDEDDQKTDGKEKKGPEKSELEKSEPENTKISPGRLYVVGMGPGSLDGMTKEAFKAMEDSQVIAGYTVYADLVKPYFPEKEYLTTSMTKEEARCRMAFECCIQGKNTAMICSGDSGVYGMAGLILELAPQYPGVEIKMIPGVTAACAGAAGLGAPLTHDFAVISLSDRLTPIEMIWERIEKAAQADFVICLYNPRSKGRPDYLKQACERIMKYRTPETICGIASCIGRDGEEMKVMTLKELADYPADMFTTVFIGKSSTVKIGKWMVTPRGYRVHE